MKENTKKTLKIYWQKSLNYKFSVIVVFISVFCASLIGVIIPIFYKNFFDILASGLEKNSLISQLISIILIILGLDFLGWCFWRFATFYSNYFQSKVMTDLSNYCFAYLHRHSFSFFNNNFVGSLVKKVKWFSRAFETIGDKIIWNLFPLFVNIAIIILVLLSRNWLLSLVVLVWIILFLLVNLIFTNYKLKYDILRSEAETKTTGFLADSITNNSVIKLFVGFSREVKGFGKVNEDLRKLRKLTWDLDGFFEALQGFLMVILEFGIFYLAVFLWLRNILTVGDFVLIQAYLINIFHRVWEFGRVLRQTYEALSDAEEMTVILNTPHEIKDILGAKDLKIKKGRIEFKNVDFYYYQTRKVLSDFNLIIEPGQRLALIGPSGAGKTTIVRLLLRLYNLSGGQIFIDNQDVSKVTQESLWKNISLVPQDPILFHRPLSENIVYGRPDASETEIVVSAKAAHCHEFITKFPDGYNTHVGERGVKLSGGERQRVAIARAILRNSPILILDEATSSLDSESELLIQDALDKLMDGKTVIAIAHRLSTIRKMDRIIVVDQGGIIEEGSHEELLKNKRGLYKRLWQLQAGGFIQD